MPSKDSGAELSTKRYPGRVNMTARVYTGDAYEVKEVPLVVGVLGDFRGASDAPLAPLHKREFAEVRPDTLDAVIKKTAPVVKAEVENRLRADGSKFEVTLRIGKLSDFNPDAVAEQVPEIAELVKLRRKLQELRARLAGNKEWAGELKKVLGNETSLKALKSALSADN